VKKIHKIILIVIGINLCIAAAIASDAVGSISISPCATNCISLNVPQNLNQNTPKFLSRNGDTIIIKTNYPLEKGIEINDIKQNGGFELQVTTSPVFNTNNEIVIPYNQNIGILTFTSNNNYTMDSLNPDNTITALNQKNFRYAAAPTPYTPTDFIYFTGSNASESDVLTNLFTAPVNPIRRGTYESGFAVIIKTPSNPETINSLRDGNLHFNLNFTLINT
jgi:hypothetical protein